MLEADGPVKSPDPEPPAFADLDADEPLGAEPLEPRTQDLPFELDPIELLSTSESDEQHEEPGPDEASKLARDGVSVGEATDLGDEASKLAGEGVPPRMDGVSIGDATGPELAAESLGPARPEWLAMPAFEFEPAPPELFLPVEPPDKTAVEAEPSTPTAAPVEGPRLEPYALIFAARELAFGRVRSLLAAGLDPNMETSEASQSLPCGTRALAAAVSATGPTADRDVIVRLLVGSGARIDATDVLGNTALHLAIGEVSLVRTLLELGADADVANREGCTPLMLAAERGLREAAAALKGAGADTQGLWNLELMKAIVAFDVPRIRKALAAKATTAKVGQRALVEAIRGGRVDVARLLLETGSDATVPDPTGVTPMQAAKDCGHTDLIAILLKAGARYDERPTDRPGRA